SLTLVQCSGRPRHLPSLPTRRSSDLAGEFSTGPGEGFEPGQEEWMNGDLGSRTEIEQTLDTRLDNVFTEEPAEAAARAAQDAARSEERRVGKGGTGGGATSGERRSRC